MIQYLSKRFPDLPWGDSYGLIHALDVKQLGTEKYLTVHILDNGDLFVEIGGNEEKFVLGAGKYITDSFTINAGASRTWTNFLNAQGKSSFYVGVGFTYKF